MRLAGVAVAAEKLRSICVRSTWSSVIAIIASLPRILADTAYCAKSGCASCSDWTPDTQPQQPLQAAAVFGRRDEPDIDTAISNPTEDALGNARLGSPLGMRIGTENIALGLGRQVEAQHQSRRHVQPRAWVVTHLAGGLVGLAEAKRGLLLLVQQCVGFRGCRDSTTAAPEARSPICGFSSVTRGPTKG